MNPNSERFSPRSLARVLGILTLIGIGTGAFDIGYVHSKLIVANDAAATFHNILTHQTLFRWGFSAHLLELLINIPGEVLFFILFRRVNRAVAAVALCCGVVGIGVEAVALLSAYVPLQLAVGANTLGSFSSQQLQALSSLSSQMQQAGLLLSWIFYGVDELLSGALIFRSGFVPRIFGVLLSLSGLCYFTHGFLSFLAPALDSQLMPYILFPCAPGESLIALWLAIMGLNVARWRAWTTALQPELSFA